MVLLPTLFGLLDVLLKSQDSTELRVRRDVGLDSGLLAGVQLPAFRPGELIVRVRHVGAVIRMGSLSKREKMEDA